LFVFYAIYAMTIMFVVLPIAMSRDPAAVSTSCDDLLAEFNARRCDLVGQTDLIAELRNLEDYLNTLNNRQGLGFVVNGAVLDKRKIRQMMIAAGGIFTTVVPFVIALHSAYSEALPVYGQMANSSRIYAYSPKPRSYAEASAFCESLWMKPVSIHSTDESDAVVELTGTKQNGACAWVGAKRGGNAGADNVWKWVDGSPWEFENSLFQQDSAGPDYQTNLQIYWDNGMNSVKWDDDGHRHSRQGTAGAEQAQQHSTHRV